ncbi:peptide synthetase [Diplodia corticola]|uniref:Peptide synthetase n=1 Tax=Diplodia corticola TaxID=236234 RepID=A0A1J9RTY3_9PEZI|nr:peptide synthetase [Diplodia corticola]OJD30965.1 peptide synthetase [Diplodia corticola]
MTRKLFPSVLALFQNICQRYPNNIAVQDGLETLTYRALDQRSSALARRLQKAGARPSQVIPILTSSCLHMVVGVLAILKTGGIYVPIDRDQWPRERIDNVLGRTSTGLAVYTGRPMDIPDTTLVSVEEVADQDPSDDREEAVPLPDVATIIFTSGTTGEPKGVEIRQESLAKFVTTPRFNYDVTPEDRVLLVLSVAFDACMGTLFSTLCNGGTVVLANRNNLQEKSRQCSVIVATPSILEALEPPVTQQDYPHLDRMVLGGETASKRLLECWDVLKRPIWIAYGPTEATCATLSGIVQRCPESGEFRPTMLGTAIDGARVTIVDDRGDDIDALDEEGELLISGTGLARGYWRDERRTDEKFIIHNGRRAYRTGDLVRWSVSGQGSRVIEFCGRRDRMVKVKGFLVNLELDVDAALLAMEPSLKAVHSVMIGKKLCTAVSPPVDDAKNLRMRWMARSPAYLVPDHIVGLDSLPTTPNGKTDPRKLARMLEAMVPSAEGDAGDCKDLKSAIVSGMARILDVPVSTIDVDQPFVSQGLHSLAAVMLSSHCRRLGFAVRVGDMLAAPSISSLLHSTQGLSIECASPSRNIRESPLTTLQKVLIYDSVQHRKANVVQHVSVYHTRNIRRLQAAWQTVVAAEPIFRTELDLDTQTQRIVDEAPFLWSEHDVVSQQDIEQRWDEAAGAAGLGACFTVLHCQGADLPCNESMLIFSIHHALIDGFSASLILNKVAAALDGRPFEPSPPFPAAVESLQALSTRTAMEADMFWRQQERAFPDAAGEMLLPKPPSAPSPDSGAVHAEHSIQTGIDVAGLTKYARASQTTPAAVHYAAWALVLASYANADTVAFGAVVSARSLGFDGADTIIGPLITTQPLRVSVDRDGPSAGFVQHMYRTVQALSRFQAAERKGEPLAFCSALAIQFDAPALERASVEPLRPPVVKECPGLPLNVLVEGDGRVRFLYRRDAFADDHVRHMAAVYRNLLQALTQPELSVGQCLRRRLGRELSRMVLSCGNHGSPPTYVGELGETVTSLVEKAARANAGAVAVERGAAKLTYAELMACASRVAGVAEKLVRPGDVVCVVADRSINWIVGVCAALKAGAVYCPLDASHAPEYRAELLWSSGATLLLCTESAQLQDPMPGGPVALAIDQILASGVQPSPSAPRLQSARDAAFVCFTSGSTGKPKGVVCEHGGVVAFHADPEVRLNSGPGVRIAQFLSPGFDGCVHEVFASLCYGATLVLRTEPDNPFSHLGHVDVAMMTPSVAAGLDPADYPNLTCVYFAGEPVQQQTADKWAPGRRLYNLYGPTEGTIGACQSRLHAGSPVSVGPPVPSTRLYVLDDALELAPPGVIGNIFIAGVQVSRGYINMPAQTARDFVPDPFNRTPAERMYRTGDLGFWDARGNVNVCGRRDRQIKMRGFRVNLDDVGAVAAHAMPAVTRAVATEHGGRLVLWVEPEAVDTTELARRLRRALPQHAQPKHIAAVQRLPLSRNGKLDARALALQAAAFEPPCGQATKPAAGLTRFEALLAQEWRLLLGLDAAAAVAPDDCFTALGGHSVLQLGLAARLRSVCKIPLSVKDVINAPTLADLAALVERRVRGREAAPQRVSRAQLPLGRTRLSPAELEWWHRYQAAETACAFNVPWAAELQPGVDRLRLAAALEAALNRHSILRSRFVVGAGSRGVERAIADEPITVQVVESVDVKAFVNQPFDLAHGPLVRVALSPSIVALSVSHIVCDLTALQTVLAEVATLYNGGELGPVQREYFDTTAWSQPTELESAFFWSANLHGLQLRRPDDDDDVPARKLYRGTSQLLAVPADLYHGILALTATSGLTLHQFGLAATGVVLHALCGRNDVVLGSPYVNRTSVDDQSVVGLFLQPLPVRVRAADPLASTSTDVLRGVQCASQSSLAHAMPWPRLLQHLGLPFPSHRQQLFDCVVTFHDDRSAAAARSSSPVFPVAGARPLHVWTEGAKFAVLFEWHVFADRLSVRLEYDTDCVPALLVSILQKMLLLAVDRLLDPTCRYEQLLRGLHLLLQQQCLAVGADVEEMRATAVKHLRGV